MSNKKRNGRPRRKMKTVKIPMKDWVYLDEYCGKDKNLHDGIHEIVQFHREYSGDIEKIEVSE